MFRRAGLLVEQCRVRDVLPFTVGRTLGMRQCLG